MIREDQHSPVSAMQLKRPEQHPSRLVNGVDPAEFRSAQGPQRRPRRLIAALMTSDVAAEIRQRHTGLGSKPQNRSEVQGSRIEDEPATQPDGFDSSAVLRSTEAVLDPARMALSWM